MARLQRPDPSNATSSAPTKEVLWHNLRDLFSSQGFDTEFARYFVREVCSPYCEKLEHPYRKPVSGSTDLQRWEEPYRERLMQCASVYIRMSDADRRMLHAGAEDGVKWRGESIRQYVDICNETMRMREIGVDKYRAEVRAKLHAFGIR